MNEPILFHQLPLYARIAIERLIADESLRSNLKLDELLDAYAAIYGEECCSVTRDNAHRYCMRMFRGAFSILG